MKSILPRWLQFNNLSLYKLLLPEKLVCEAYNFRVPFHRGAIRPWMKWNPFFYNGYYLILIMYVNVAFWGSVQLWSSVYQGSSPHNWNEIQTSTILLSEKGVCKHTTLGVSVYGEGGGSFPQKWNEIYMIFTLTVNEQSQLVPGEFIKNH